MAETRKMVSFHLFIELVTEVLLRLPAKSLFRFKSVCKTWYALIENPYFIEQHHKYRSNINSTLITTNNRIYINIEGNYRPISFGSLFSKKNVSFYLLGVCNGLVCFNLYKPYRIFIGNPTTQEFRKIPSQKLLNEEGHRELYGFGSFSNDYKLVRLIYCSNVRVEVYSMRTDCWEEIDVKMAHFVETWNGDAFFCTTRFMHVVLNGVFHWIASRNNLARIISFDVCKGIFFEIKVPLSVFDAQKDPWRILEFDGELCLLITKDDNKFELWVLNEDRNNWTLKLRIDDIPNVAVPDEYWSSGIDVMGYAKNGELLIEDGCDENTKMFTYDMYSRKIKMLPQFDYHDDNYYYFYNESLRSVKLRNDVAESGYVSSR